MRLLPILWRVGPGLLTARQYTHRFSAATWLLIGGDLLEATAQNMVRPYLALSLARQGTDLAAVGVVLAAGPLAYLLMGGVGGSLADRYGRRPLLIGGLLCSGAALAALRLARAALVYGLLFFLMTAFRSLYEPAFRAALADVTDPSRQMEAFGLRRVARNLGALAGPALGFALFIRSHGATFMAAGLLLALLGLALFLLLPEPRPGALREELGEAGAWRAVLTDRSLLLFIACAVGFKGFERLFDSYLPALLAERVPDILIPAMVMTNALMVVLLQVPISIWLSRFRMGTVFLLGGAVYAAGWGAFALAGGASGLLLATCLVALGEIVQKSAGSVFIWSIAPEHLRGRYAGAAGMAELGPVLLPVLSGSLAAAVGMAPMFGAMAVLAVAAGALGWGADAVARRTLCGCVRPP